MQLENGVLESLIFLNFYHPVSAEDSSRTRILLLCPARGVEALFRGPGIPVESKHH